MLKKISSWLLIFLLFLISFGCTQEVNKNLTGEEQEKDKLLLKADNYPFYYFAKRIVGDKIQVSNLIPFGIDIHSWEPVPGDIVELEKTDLLIYNGAAGDELISRILQGLETEKLVSLDVTKGLELIATDKGENHHHEVGENHHQEEGEDGHYFDPHVWLDPVNCKIIAKNILDLVCQQDSGNEDYYTANYQKLISELEKLDEDFQEGLKDVKQKEFIVNHAAFGYLAKRYGLTQIPIMGINPNSEPTPQKMKEVSNIVTEHKVKYIFTEKLVSSKVALILAEEAGIKTKVLNPLGNILDEDIAQGKDYFSIMYDNLAVLQESLN